MRQDRAAIYLFCVGDASEEAIVQLITGMEEEGIPSLVKMTHEQDALALATEACELSPLGVGLGLDSREAVLMERSLTQPLFLAQLDTDVQELRTLGTNAARLVKKQPFK